jgi:hypothetical protein
VVPVVGGQVPTDLSHPLGAETFFVPFTTDGIPQEFDLRGFSIPVTRGDQLALVFVSELQPGGTRATLLGGNQ